ncbi:hypothetical protein BH10PSE12_BH10PSE12_01890 [soil metagenome]
MPEASFMYRVGQTGADEVRAQIKAIGSDQEESALRAVKSAEAAARQIERIDAESASKRANLQAKVAAINSMIGSPANAAAYESAKRNELVLAQNISTRSQAQARAVVSTGQLRAGSQQLSYQIGDVSQQLSAGTPILTIFSQQMGQTIQAVQLMTGASKGFVGFLAGPWGAAISGGVLLLANLAGKYLFASDAADKKTDAAKTLRDAITDLNAATSKQVMTEEQAAASSLNHVKALYDQEVQTRKTTRALLDKAIAEAGAAKAANVPGSPSYVGAGVNEFATQGLVNGLRAQLAENESQLGKARLSVSRLELPGMQRAVKEQFDASAAASGKYDRALGDLNNRYVALKISAADYQKELARITKTRDAEIDAAKPTHATKAPVDREAAKAARDALRSQEDWDRTTSKNLDGIGKGAEDRAVAVKKAWVDAYDPVNQAYKDIQQSQNESLALGGLELTLKGRTTQEIRDQVEMQAFIFDLNRRGIKVGQDGVDVLLVGKQRLMDQTEELYRQRDAMREFQQFGDQMVDTFLSPNTWSSWGNAGKSILRELENEFLKLALINPIKNLLSPGNTSLPTLGSITKLFGFATGTEYFSGGRALVGENGPEVASFPAGTRITPAAATRRMMAGNDNPSVTHVHVYANDSVLTETVVGWVKQGMDVASVRGAAGGAAMAQADAASNARRRLGRGW